MNLLRKVALMSAALAFLSAAVVPLSISACPASKAKVNPCCCCKPGHADDILRRCPCKKPAGELPGSPCVIQKSLPSGTLPSVATPIEGGLLLCVIPASLELPAVPSAVSPLHARIEPGWDPGSPGFVLPLRL